MSEYLKYNLQETLSPPYKWTDPSIFKEVFEPYREVLRPATSKIVKNNFSEFIKPGDKVLEIGSGIGEVVYNLAPEYRGRIQQTDASYEIIKEHKEKYPDSNITYANIYKLPFETASIDVVFGFSSFDVFGDLNGALKEVERVLKPGGNFIHFLDAKANDDVLVENLKIKEQMVPITILSENGNLDEIKLVPVEIFEKEKHRLPGIEPFMEFQFVDEFLETIQKKSPELLSNFYLICEKALNLSQFESTSLNQYFYNHLLNEINNNLQVIKFQEEFGAYVQDMSLEDCIKNENINFIVQDYPGNLKSFKNEGVTETYGRGKRFIATHVHVAVARKV